MEAKWDSKLQSGPLHLLHEVQRQTMHFCGEELEFVRKYTQLNGFLPMKNRSYCTLYVLISLMKEK